MSKLIIKLAESTSAANPYLSEDGLLNFSKIETLQGRVATAIKAAAKSEEGPIKVTSTYVMKRRAKPTAFRKAAHEKGTDLKYRASRAIKIAMRKRLSPESLGRVAIVLQVIDNAKLNPLLKQAVSAITQHMNRTVKHIAKLSTEKAKIRDKANTVFEKSTAMLKSVLLQGGVKDKDMVESVGMMGRTLLIRLGTDNYVSVTKADKTRFATATRAAAQ